MLNPGIWKYTKEYTMRWRKNRIFHDRFLSHSSHIYPFKMPKKTFGVNDWSLPCLGTIVGHELHRHEHHGGNDHLLITFFRNRLKMAMNQYLV